LGFRISLRLLTACEAAQKLIALAKSALRRWKRGHILHHLSSRVELVPFPKSYEIGFSATTCAVGFILAPLRGYLVVLAAKKNGAAWHFCIAAPS
jgi:hypothetical protein